MRSWWRASARRVLALRVVHLVQDRERLLDTWFSSALGRFPRSAGPIGQRIWPPSTPLRADHGLRHPVLLVARMIMMGIDSWTRCPSAKSTYRAGARRERQKMSKTRATPSTRCSSQTSTAPTPCAWPCCRRFPRRRYRAHRRAHGKLARLRQQDLERGAISLLNMERSRVEPGPDNLEQFRPLADADSMEVRIEDGGSSAA